MLDSYVICVSALHLEIVISHKIVGVPILRLVSIILPRGCQSAAFRRFHLVLYERVIRLVGLEPTTPRLSSACSNQLSYSRVDVEGKDRDSCRRLRLRGVDLRTFVLLLHRKEVIQPQVPLRLPCYDFIPVTSLTLGPCLLTVGS